MSDCGVLNSIVEETSWLTLRRRGCLFEKAVVLLGEYHNLLALSLSFKQLLKFLTCLACSVSARSSIRPVFPNRKPSLQSMRMVSVTPRTKGTSRKGMEEQGEHLRSRWTFRYGLEISRKNCVWSVLCCHSDKQCHTLCIITYLYTIGFKLHPRPNDPPS